MQIYILDTIKKIRERKYIDQITIANHLNISSNAYSQKENGKQKIRMSEILSIFDLLEIKLFLDNEEVRTIKDISNLIKSKRIEKGYTQDYTSRKVNVTKESYCNKENNKATLYLSETLNICDFLNIGLSLNVSFDNTSNLGKSTKYRRVKCLNNNKAYNSIKEASEDTGASQALIVKCCKGQRKSAGKINGEKAVWQYIE